MARFASRRPSSNEELAGTVPYQMNRRKKTEVIRGSKIIS